MNKTQYAAYEASVARNLKGLEHVSTGACPGCAECGLDKDCTDHARELAEESSFSWHACESCGSRLGGDRHPAHGVDKEGNILHLSICVDCLSYLNYGQLDDMAMMEIEEG